MLPSSRTPEEESGICPVCGNQVVITPSRPPGDAPCPSCGSLIWFPAGGRENQLGLRQFKITDATIRTKREAIAAVLDQLILSKAIERSDRESMLEAILKREEIGSTGIGRGFAVPHGRHPNLRELVSAVATLAEPIEFGSLDREPVHTIFIVLSPTDRPGDHLRMLEAISRSLRSGW